MRRLALVLLALLVCPFAVRANQRWQGYCQTQNTGIRVTNCVVTVYQTGTLTKATIFQDALNTPQSNPFNADLTSGLWAFYATNGRYDINLSAGSPSISPAYTLSDYLLFDPAGFGAALTLGSVSSQSSNVAQSGFVRMAPGDCASWRNNANTLDNCLTENTSDQLTYSGAVVGLLSVNQTWTGTQNFPSVSGMTSASTNPAGSGLIRLSASDTIGWRNAANNGDITLQKSLAVVGNVPVDTLSFQSSLTSLPAALDASFVAFSATGNNMAKSGVLRLESGDAVAWRNAANTADLTLLTSSADVLTWSGTFSPTVLQSPTANPAHIGVIRLASGDQIESRDSINATDVLLIGLDALGFVDIGNATFPPFVSAPNLVFAGNGTITSNAPFALGNGSTMSIVATAGRGSGGHNGGNVVLTAGNGVNGGASGVTQITPVRTFSALPTCIVALEGSLVPVSDSTTNTWGATITGGGTNHVLAYCDNASWTVAAK